MFCNYCGKQIQEDANVCAYCGRLVGVRVVTRPPLVRPRLGRKIGGVCLGLAHHLAMDPTLVRIGVAQNRVIRCDDRHSQLAQ